MGTLSVDARQFVLAHTRALPVPFVPEIRVRTACELLPLWQASERWLTDRGVALPYWCVPWAGGVALARFLLDTPGVVRGQRVIDFGAGGGLVALAAARAGARAVRAVDIDPLAAAACALAADDNGLSIEIACEDIVGTAVDADLIVAGDVWYEAEPSARHGRWLRAEAARGVRVLTGDPGRTYVPTDVRMLAEYEVPTTVELESSEVRRTRILEFGRPTR